MNDVVVVKAEFVFRKHKQLKAGWDHHYLLEVLRS